MIMQERNQTIGHLLLGIVVLTWGANFRIVKSAFETIRSIDGGLIFSYDSAPLILFIDGDCHDLVQDNRFHYIHRFRPDALRRNGTGSCITLSI
jgi:hypothetical protein